MDADRAKLTATSTRATPPIHSAAPDGGRHARGQPDANSPLRAANVGRIVLVEAGASVPLEVVFSATRNRLLRHPGLSFAERWTTGRAIQRTSNETIVSRRLFSALAEDGSFALTWHEAGTPMAVPAEILTELNAGTTVVLQARGEIAEAALRFAADVVVLSLITSNEGNKAGLSRMACMERMTDLPLRVRLQAMREQRASSISRQSITVPAASAAAVEALSALLARLARSAAHDLDPGKRTDAVTPSSRAPG